jgi:hypothetical protein
VLLVAGAARPGAAGEAKAGGRRPQVRVPGLAGLYVERAIAGAARRLGDDRCRGVLSDFSSEAEGRPLAAVLAERGRTPQEHLASVEFVDGSEKAACAHGESFAGMIRSGDDVVYVCPTRFRELARANPAAADAVVLHEMLHTLGLGENPPTSLQITARVLERCATAPMSALASSAPARPSRTVAPVRGTKAGSAAANARLRHPAQRMALAQAVLGAARKLAHAECEALLDEFKDRSDRPLRDTLVSEGVTATEFLDRVLFYDAPQNSCENRALVFTGIRSRVVWVCGRRFLREMTESASHAEAAVIHEMLHSLGLGEDPPSSAYITARVMARCRQ